MPSRLLAASVTAAFALACKTSAPMDKPASSDKAAAAQPAASPVDQRALVAALVGKLGEGARPRAERGVRQVAAFWRAEDGDAAALRSFVEEAFVADPAQLEALQQRFSAAFE